MANRRNPSVMVWIPDYQAYLAVDAEELLDTPAAIQLAELWAREADIRVYVARDEVAHNARIRGLAYKVGENE